METDPHPPHPPRPSSVSAGTVYGRGGVPVSGEKQDLFSRLHPAITATVAASFIAVLTLGYLAWRSTMAAEPSLAAGSATVQAAPVPTTESPEASPSPSPSVSPTGATLTAGMWSLESAGHAGSYIRRKNGLGVVETIDPGRGSDSREATLIVTNGLSDRSCFSFRTADGRYLRHYAFRLRFDRPDGSSLFAKDATFCAVGGTAADSVRLRSVNYPDRVLHARGSELWLDRPDGSSGFRAESSFTVRSPLAGQ
jgi:hypothetical protein